MRTMTIFRSDKQARRIRRAAKTGAYAANSEALREALRLWEQREEVRALELERLKQAYEAGLASGPGREVEADALLAEFKRKAGLSG